MVDRSILTSRIEAIERHLGRLASYTGRSLEDFLADPDAQDIVEYNLFQIINHLIDILQHVVVDEKLGFPESAYDAAEILLKKGVLSERESEAMRKMIGFRNIVGHDYVSISKAIVQEILVTELEDIKRIISVIADRYL